MTRHLFVLLFLTASVACRETPAATTAQAATEQAEAPAPVAASQPSGQPAAATPTQAPAPAAATPQTKPVPDVLPDVLARVNGEPIARSEFERALQNVEARAQQGVPAERRSEIYRGVLDQLVAMHVLAQESKARKIAVSDAEVDGRIAEIKKQFPSEDEFNKALAGRSMTLQALRDETRQEMVVSRLVESEVAPKVSVQERDIKDFYDKNPERFQQPESVRASHILIRLEPNATEVQKNEARGKAESLLQQLKGGADFAALAKEHSQDGSAPAGGDLNFFGRGQMVPPFEQAAFALQPGQLSDVVETQFGFHVIKVTERRPARTVPLAEVAQRIAQFLTRQQQQQQTETFINQLKSKSKIEILI